MKLSKHILILALTLTTAIGFTQTEVPKVKFETKVSKKRLGVNERLRIDFIMNKDGDNFNPPNFENFTVVGGPSQSINNSWINGVRSYSKTYKIII